MKCLRTNLLLASCCLLLPGADKESLTGRVVNLNTGAPVRKAVVLLTNPPAQGAMTAQSDADGRFTFTNVEPGRYFLTALRDGYLKYSSPSLIPVTAGEQRKETLLRMTPASVIVGRIVDEAGEALADVEVAAFLSKYVNGKREWVEVTSGQTSDRGEYRIPKLIPGRYRIQTRPRSTTLLTTTAITLPLPEPFQTIYPATWYPGAQEDSGAIAVSVRAGAESGGIDIALAPVHTFRVSGKVVKPPGTGAVMAWERRGGGPRMIELHI